MKTVRILFTNDEELSNESQIKQIVSSSKQRFSVVHFKEEYVVVAKEIAKNKQSTEDVRKLAGSIAKDLRDRHVSEAVVTKESLMNAWFNMNESDVITAFVEGWELGSYAFTTYISKKSNDRVKLTVQADESINDLVERGNKRATATNFSRDLMNELSNELTPETFPTVLSERFAKEENVTVTVHDKQSIEQLEMNGVLTVARGSTYDPAFVEIRYEGDTKKPLVALVGKGVTFDTGGISLKRGRDLSDMRMDMGGAAAVAGAMDLLVSTKAQVNVVALIPIVENMPDRKSLIPGEVITYKNGSTVQVGNTDAEGRLILADGIIRAEALKASYIVDIATLTGAVVSALGTKVAGTFGSDELAELMRKVGKDTGESNWQLPLVDSYDSYLESDYADFSNISSKGEAGSITAALFLRKFVTDQSKWLHIDMAGVMETTDSGYDSKGGSGYGARLLADFTEQLS